MSAEDGLSPLERLAAWTVTGPLAFLVAGLIDLSVFTGYALRGAVRARLSRRGRQPRHMASDVSTI